MGTPAIAQRVLRRGYVRSFSGLALTGGLNVTFLLASRIHELVLVSRGAPYLQITGDPAHQVLGGLRQVASVLYYGCLLGAVGKAGDDAWLLEGRGGNPMRSGGKARFALREIVEAGARI